MKDDEAADGRAEFCGRIGDGRMLKPENGTERGNGKKTKVTLCQYVVCHLPARCTSGLPQNRINQILLPLVAWPA